MEVLADRSGCASPHPVVAIPSGVSEAPPLGSATIGADTYRMLGLKVEPLSVEETAAARREPIGMMGWMVGDGRAAALYQRVSLGRVLGLVAREAAGG